MSREVTIDTILPLVRKPGRYIGGERNTVSGEWPGQDLKFCLAFPDLYEIGMAHQGLQILYHILNRQQGMLAHRCFAPDLDMEKHLRQAGVPLFSLEARKPLCAYDVVGITLPYELCFTNILTLLDLGGIPLRATQRTTADPLVIGGGSCSFNPEPVAPFFDAIVIGDGEEAVVELGKALIIGRQPGVSRHEVLQTLAGLDGVYVPSLYTPTDNGTRFTGMTPGPGAPPKVRRRVLPSLEAGGQVPSPIVPVVKPVHDRLGIEIARGCTRGCRFCQAGMIYRPVRERNIDEILRIAEEGIRDSGFDELALLSLSTGDYSCINDLITGLMRKYSAEHVSVSMPSMRVGTLTPEIMEEIRQVRKTGFTVAPEAGTDRLREVINKGITEEDLLTTCADAFRLGWRLIKFYFMIGLPTETPEDIQAIIDLAQKARAMAPGGRSVQINVSISTFVPKPHTPFQWHRQLRMEEAAAKIDYLKQHLPRKGFKLKWHDPRMSFMEGVFSRGDRTLAALIESAWRRGARLDGWAEHFDLRTWEQAADDCGLELITFLRERQLDEVLPWSHVDCGVDPDFLHQELSRALAREYTPDCRVHGCQGCGLCDFKTVRPLVSKNPASPPSVPVQRTDAPVEEQQTFTYRIWYSRVESARFYGHLEVLQLVFRALARTGLPLRFSQGYNPSPKVSFSPALGVGIESQAEYFDMELSRPLKASENCAVLLNKGFPEGIRVQRVEPSAGRPPQAYLFTYEIRLPAPLEDVLPARIREFLSQESYLLEQVRKKKRRHVDARSLITAMEFRQGSLHLDLISPVAKAGVSPREILEKILQINPQQVLEARIMKTRCRELSS
ncbi:MAG: B12-binding domain-containing radical SAM protein [Desulfobulbus propionicus]|nr:MAG: B12-binding domain-containing radical SAM protein [Desulfobulbus propionicus]